MSVLALKDKDWSQYKATMSARVKSIQIPVDINAGMGKQILANIDLLYSDVRMDCAEIEGHKERLEILIREIERSSIKGSNELARKQASTLAVQTYAGNNGQIINLYDFQRELIEKHTFLRGLLDTMINKQNRLITINGLLKLEKELMPGSDF